MLVPSSMYLFSVGGSCQVLSRLPFQVTIVCQRMMKEREELIRCEYDKVLTTKLAGWFRFYYFEREES